MAPSLRLMQRIIDAQPVTGTFARSVVGGGGRRGVVGGTAEMVKDDILVELDRQKGLLNLLVEVTVTVTRQIYTF